MTIKDYVVFEKENLKNYLTGKSVLPKLVIIQVNDDPASCAYVKGKINDLAYIGAIYELIKLPIETTEEELLNLIKKYNEDPTVDGILVQMPLPKGISEEHVKCTISPSKDVDGFHPMSLCIPCTPKGIMDYLHAEKITIESKNAVVIGRSNIVGRPMAHLLLNEGANVCVLHSKTSVEDLKKYIKNADIIVCAVGKKYLLNHEFEFKKDAILIDVGINRIKGKLYGDMEPDLPVYFQTPVPGGVGLLTRLSMMENLILCYKNHYNLK